MGARRRRRCPFLVGVVLALVVAGCSAVPEAQLSPRPTVQSSASPPNYSQLGESIEKAIASGSVGLDTIGAVLISVDGQTVLTHYRNGRRPDKTLHMWSVTKSVTSALIGIALEEKIIGDLDQTLGELLPRYRAQMKGEIAGITLRQLMTMSAGFQDELGTPSLIGDVFRQDGDAVAFILRRALVSSPGETFAYSSSSAHLVTAVLAQALREADGSNPRTVLDYAMEKLFEPLGIDTRHAYTARFRPDDVEPFEKAGFGWATDAQGINSGCCLLRLRPADMLKFGQLYLDHGTWHGRQLVPKKWVADSVAPSPTSSQYGYMWWLETTPSGDLAYAARGSAGELILVVPEHQLVVAVASQPTKDYATDSEDVFALVSDVILKAFA
jgi:CubicO group peptidase (beta-lactamase class C family)